jgi:hypothetical protein
LSTSRSIRASTAAACAAAGRVLAAVVTAGAAVAPAGAHGFGQRYDLPLPLPLYLFGAASAVVVSFLLFGLFVRRTPEKRERPYVDLLDYRLGRVIAGPAVRFPLQLISVGLLLLIVIAGFWGQQNPYQNIAPTLVWVVGWVGMAYVSAFVGDLWALINPWRRLFVCGQWLYSRAARAHAPSKSLRYPEALGVWPAFFLLLAFAWTELAYPAAAVPSRIAWLAVVYSLLTWTAMVVFGAEIWLRHGEVFSVVFGILARFAPTESRSTGPGQRILALRPFAVGLIDAPPVSVSMTALVLLILSSVIFDGVLGLPQWIDLESSFSAGVPSLGDASTVVLRTFGLIAAWAIFFGAYLSVCVIVRATVDQDRPAMQVARDFALTLVPIAIGYHLAHYLTYVLIQGQYILPLMSDPFGYGWDLLGTAGYRVDIALVDARLAWYIALGAIVCGHVIAVWLAHVRAIQVFGMRSTALRSQVPLTALMVVYTFVSLSILAEPLTERRASAPSNAAAPGVIEVPPDALLPEPASGRLKAVGAGQTARTKMTYRMLGSAFHDGTRTNIADLLYAYAFAYRWGARNPAIGGGYDPVIDSATAGMREHLVGFRVVGTDTVSKSFRVADVEFVRELFVIDVYTTIEPGDPEQDAAAAPPWSTVPWHLLVLMEEAVSRGCAAFSQVEAARRGVEWLDLVRSDPIKKQLASLVETFEREGYRPEALQPLVSRDEARKRWAAIAAFYQAHGHFLITNGPYQLKSWSTGHVELEAFRDLSYPLGVGSYDAYAIPRRAFVSKVERQNDRLRLFGSAETIMKYQRSYELVREPLQSVEPDVLKRSAPECQYVVIDVERRVVQAGRVGLSDDTTFYVDLDRRLPPGNYTVLAEITLNRNTMNAEIQRIPVAMPPQTEGKQP